MTKREHKQLITIKKVGSTSWHEAYYLDIYCGNYPPSYKISEIKEDVYSNLNIRGLLIG